MSARQISKNTFRRGHGSLACQKSHAARANPPMGQCASVSLPRDCHLSCDRHLCGCVHSNPMQDWAAALRQMTSTLLLLTNVRIQSKPSCLLMRIEHGDDCLGRRGTCQGVRHVPARMCSASSKALRINDQLVNNQGIKQPGSDHKRPNLETLRFCTPSGAQPEQTLPTRRARP